MASLFNSKHNKYVSIPDWFKDTDLNVEQTVEHKTTYVGGGGSVVGTTSGLSNVILYNKFVVEDTELGKEALTVIDTVLNATESETTKIGETVSLSGWNTTDYISVASNSIMIVTSYIDSELNKLYGILFYDNTRSVIGSHLLTSSPEEVNVPANSYYFRISAQIVDSFKVSYKVPKEYDTEQLAQSNNNVTDYLSLDTTIPEGLNETVVADSALKLLVQSPLTLTRDLNNVIKLSMKQNNETNTNDMFVWDKKLAAFGFDITLGQAYSYIDGLQLFDSDGNPIMTNNPDFWLYDENLTDKWIIKSTRPRLSLLDNLFEYDSEKNCFILHSNLATTGGIVAYANTEDINIDDIYDGLPIDNQTLYWKEIEEEVGTDEEGNPIYNTTKVLKAKGGDGNGSGGNTTVDLTIKYDGAGNAITELKYNDGVLTAIKGNTFAATSGLLDIDNRVTSLEAEVNLYSGAINTHTIAIGEIETSITEIKNNYATKDFVTNEITQKIDGVAYVKWVEDNFVNFDDYQTISAIKNFEQGIEVNGQLLKYSKDNECWVMEGDLLVSGGITAYGSESSFIPSTIMDAIVCDEQTITIEEKNGIKMLKVIGGGSTGSVDLTPYATKEYVIGAITSNVTGLASENWVKEYIAGLEGGGTIDLSSYAEKTWVSSEFASLKGDNTFSGINKFNGGLFVNDKQIKYNSKGYWELEGDLLVTGGITSFASSSGFTPSTIMDGVAVDGVTIIKQNGILVAVGGDSGDSPDLSAYATMDWVSQRYATSSQLSAVETKVNNKWTADDQKIDNWDLAYSWGNHAEEGYVTAFNLTEILTNYVTVKDDKQQIIEGEKNFVGGLLVNGQKLEYNSDGYWKMEGNLLVTGGITAYSSDGNATPFLINADTWEGITSNSATQVYSAKSVTLLKDEVQSVGVDADSALAKLEIIKDELSTLTESSLTTAIRNALLNIKEKI